VSLQVAPQQLDAGTGIFPAFSQWSVTIARVVEGGQSLRNELKQFTMFGENMLQNDRVGAIKGWHGLALREAGEAGGFGVRP
jgi:hypothetical protein